MTQDERLHAKALVVAVDGHAKAYSLGDLADKPIINDTVSGKEVVVFLERSTDTAIVYERQVNERPLTFDLLQEGSGAQALLRDIETGTTWTALTGVVTNGPLKEEWLRTCRSGSLGRTGTQTRSCTTAMGRMWRCSMSPQAIHL